MLKDEKQQQGAHTSQLYNTTFESSKIFIWVVDWLHSVYNTLNDMGKNVNMLNENIKQNISVLESFPKEG